MLSMFRVLKFGGSSVGSATRISNVLDIVAKEAAKGRVVLVSSAISGCTDALLGFSGSDSLQAEGLRQRHLEIVRRLFTGEERVHVSGTIGRLFSEMLHAPDSVKVTYGEIFSTSILAAKLEADGYRTQWLDSRELIIKDDIPLSYRKVREAVEASDAEVFMAPGFICGTSFGAVSTLGRGGSDYSAALFAAALGAESLQIWTDVPGIMTADPRKVPHARTIPEMTYGAALEMASHGAKVLYAPTVAPAMEAGIAIEILNSFDPDGRKTVISASARQEGLVGLASEPEGSIVRLCLVGQKGRSGADVPETAEAGNALATAGIAPLRLWSEGGNVFMTVRSAVERPALRALHRAFFEAPAVKVINVFIAGNGAVGKALAEMIRSTAATVAERTGKSLKVVGIADSRRYCIDLSGHPVLSAGRPGPFAGHPGPFAGRPGPFAGTTAFPPAGLPEFDHFAGKTAFPPAGSPEFDHFAGETAQSPAESPEFDHFAGTTTQNPAGSPEFDHFAGETAFPPAEAAGDYIDEVCALAPKGSVFVDCTDSETLYQRFPQLFEAGLNVVSSNRRSLAVPYVTYSALLASARENGVFFRYETTVGSALPFLESIIRGANSCDEILSIEAIVSCTLNRILSEYRPGGESFASMVRKAHQEGLTEADPRLDLGGRDALRKLLILGREAGVRLEESDVRIEPVVPREIFDGSIDDFYNALEGYEPEFAAAARESEIQGFRRRFVAFLEKTPGGFRSGIAIRNVNPSHPAYHLRGTENSIIIRSAFHPYPVVIQGPGEGARDAASSILNDILK